MILDSRTGTKGNFLREDFESHASIQRIRRKEVFQRNSLASVFGLKKKKKKRKCTQTRSKTKNSSRRKREGGEGECDFIARIFRLLLIFHLLLRNCNLTRFFSQYRVSTILLKTFRTVQRGRSKFLLYRQRIEFQTLKVKLP